MTGSAPGSPAIGASPLSPGAPGQLSLGVLPRSAHELPVLLAAPNRSGLRTIVSGAAYPLLRLSAWSASLALPTARPTMPSADSCATVGSPLDFPSSSTGTMAQSSPGKFDRLHRTPAGSTALALMDLDFAIRRPLVRPRMPHIRFLSVRSRLCSAKSRCRRGYGRSGDRRPGQCILHVVSLSC